ncbi:MAG: DUF4388 domain-containing protein, partial [bacterium]|nr:DUF4388 domain-containing protein [bacterium]
VAATLESLTGENAVYEIFNWNNGEFTFDPTAAVAIHNISMDTQNLIMESVRQLDEWEKFADVVPDGNYVVAFAADPSDRSENLTLQATEWKVLSMIDGRNSVAEIAGKIGFSEFETTNIVYELAEVGLLRVLPPRPDAGKNGKKTKKTIRDLLIASSGASDSVMATDSPDFVGSNVAIFALFINALLDNYGKPNGLYNVIKQDRTLIQRISEWADTYPETAVIKITEDDRIDVVDLDIKTNTLDEDGKGNLIAALHEIKEQIYKCAEDQSNKIAAGRRHDKVMLAVFTGDKEPGKIGLSEVIRQKT